MSQTHSLPAAAPLDAADVDPTPAAAAAAQPDAAVSEPSNDQRAVTWIVKDGGNRRMAFDRSRLQRTLDRIHAEFP